VIPTRNEAQNVAALIQKIDRVFDPGTLYEIDFIDDSTDNGATLHAIEAARIHATRGNVRAFHRAVSNGLSGAILDGIHGARSSLIIVMDGDGQHPPELLPAILQSLIIGNELVIPTRYGQGAPGFSGPLMRRVLSRGARALGRAMVPALERSTDPASGFFGLHKHVVEDARIEPRGWKLLADILALGHYVSLDEIPYTFLERMSGKSNLGLSAHVDYLRQLWALRRASKTSAHARLDWATVHKETRTPDVRPTRGRGRAL